MTNGINITGNIEFNRDYKVLSGVTINAGVSDIYCGLYDCEFKNRVSDGVIDIGTYEF